MTQQFAAQEPQFAPPEPFYMRLSDPLVILSATLGSVASGAWLIAQAGLDLSYAILVALGAYCALLVLHLVMRRSLVAKDPVEIDDDDDDSDVHWQTGPEAFEAALSRQPGQAEPPALPKHAAGTDASGWPEPLPMPPLGDAPDTAQAFTYRPARMPYFEPGTEADADAAAPGRPRDAGATLSELPAEMNVEVIQDLIKKLADELNGPVARDGDDRRALEPDAMIGRSVLALDTTVRAMRGPDDKAAALLPPPAAAEADTAEAGTDAPGDDRRDDGPDAGRRALDPQLARIAEAIEAERFEVMLEPIHVLAEGRPRHYEVSMRLRAADGSSMEQADYTRAAQSSDLLPRLDAARMLRAARVARRLAERGRQGSVLSAMAGDSITDNAFLDAAAQQTGNDGRVRLVLSFAQADARAFTPAHAEALGAMAASGFGFALDDVTDLEMDFGRLKALGFEFVKLDAQVFLDGMQAPGGSIPASDICRFLSEFGLTLIVGAIEDDWLLAKVMGFGVLLGKGTLFGGPRLVKADAMSKPAAA